MFFEAQLSSCKFSELAPGPKVMIRAKYSESKNAIVRALHFGQVGWAVQRDEAWWRQAALASIGGADELKE